MSTSSNAPLKHYKSKTVRSQEDINTNKCKERLRARSFISWYKHMIDNERQNLPLYLADDAMLEWFGRTIKTRKKVTAFLKYDVECSRHDFTSVESIENIQSRYHRFSRKDDFTLASPLNSPEIVNAESKRKRRVLRSNCNSPEWAPGCGPPEEATIENKRLKINDTSDFEPKDLQINLLKRELSLDDIDNNGDVIKKVKRKLVPVTPPNIEKGQGDCLPSTSGTDSDRSHDTLNAQLPKFAVECNGFIEFNRTRNNRSTDAIKWERKCKVQISFSEDPLNIGEYIIWALQYMDETKCRRNLLAAFEDAANKEVK